MKKLLWANKAVAKSAAKKGAKDFTEITNEGYDRVRDFTDDVTDKAEEAFDKAKDYVSNKTSSGGWDKPEGDFVPSDKGGSSTVEPISERMKQAAKKGNEKMKQAAKVGNETFKKAAQAGEEVLGKAVDASDKFWEKAEEVGEKVADESKDIADKVKDFAGEVTDKVNTTMDELLEKADALDKTIEDEKNAMDSDGDGFADIPTHEKLRQQGSLLDDKDDFWSKASNFAEGDYSMGKARVIGKDDSVDSDKPIDPIKGFEDLDGDGNELIDDAIIVDDDETPVNDESGDINKNLLPKGDDESE